MLFCVYSLIRLLEKPHLQLLMRTVGACITQSDTGVALIRVK